MEIVGRKIEKRSYADTYKKEEKRKAKGETQEEFGKETFTKSGGFQYPNTLLEREQPEEKPPEPEIQKNDIYNYLGVEKSYWDMDDKYMAEDQRFVSNRPQVADELLPTIDRKIQQIQHKREHLLQQVHFFLSIFDLLRKKKKCCVERNFTFFFLSLCHSSKTVTEDQEVNMHDDLVRTQVATHVLDSIERPTIENIEAIIVFSARICLRNLKKFHRQKMNVLEDQFIESKKPLDAIFAKYKKKKKTIPKPKIFDISRNELFHSFPHKFLKENTNPKHLRIPEKASY